MLSDRFTDATYAYQGCGRGLDLALISQLEVLVQKTLRPDITVYLDVDVKVVLARAAARGELDRFEKEDVDFFERVRKGYLTRVSQDPERYLVVNAGQELPAIKRDLLAALDCAFPQT